MHVANLGHDLYELGHGPWVESLQLSRQPVQRARMRDDYDVTYKAKVTPGQHKASRADLK